MWEVSLNLNHILTRFQRLSPPHRKGEAGTITNVQLLCRGYNVAKSERI